MTGWMKEVSVFDDRWLVEPQRFMYLMIGDIRWNLGQAELTKACHAAVWYQQRRRIGVCIRFKLWFWFLIYARINQRDCSWLPRNKKHPLCKFECCFSSTETIGLLGTGAQDVHLDFHTAPELWLCKFCRSQLVHCAEWPNTRDAEAHSHRRWAPNTKDDAVSDRQTMTSVLQCTVLLVPLIVTPHNSTCVRN